MKCKQGQLAFIIKSIRPENIGRIVTCSKYIGHYSRGDVVSVNGEQWTAFDTDDYWLIEGNIETQYGPSKIAYTMDSWLKPLDSDDVNDLVKEEELCDMT